MNDIIAPTAPTPAPAAPQRPVPTEMPATPGRRRIRHIQNEDTRSVIHPGLLIHLSFKNLVYKKLRTALTIIGVIIGIGAVVFLFSFGVGLQNLVNKQVIGSRSVNSVDVSSTSSRALRLNSQRIAQIESIPSVDSAGRIYNAASNAKLGTSQFESVVYGADTTYLDLSALNVVSGQILDSNATDQAVVSESVLKVAGVGSPQKALEQPLNVKFEITKTEDGSKKIVDKKFKIVGVVESQTGSEIYISNKVFENAGRNDADQVKVVVSSKDQIAQVRKEIESIGFTTSSPLDTVEQINQVFALLRYILVGFGGIGIIIAILGMFNTLTISLLERTREIALLVSLGARRQDIKRMFIIEAMLLSLIGGFIGIVGAFILGKVGDGVLNWFAHQRGVADSVSTFTITPGLFCGTLLASALLGYVVVYFPARRAARVNPIDALRYE